MDYTPVILRRMRSLQFRIQTRRLSMVFDHRSRLEAATELGMFMNSFERTHGNHAASMCLRLQTVVLYRECHHVATMATYGSVVFTLAAALHRRGHSFQTLVTNLERAQSVGVAPVRVLTAALEASFTPSQLGEYTQDLLIAADRVSG